MPTNRQMEQKIKRQGPKNRAESQGFKSDGVNEKKKVLNLEKMESRTMSSTKIPRSQFIQR